MAYNLGARFTPPPKYFTLLDPGAYQSDKSRAKRNAAPFLSREPRSTQVGIKLWTNAIYSPNVPRKIPNCSTMHSKLARFPYEACSAEDLENILCKCGIMSPCECATGKEIEYVICQGKVKRRIYIGRTPRSILGDEGLSTPSRKDHGFNISIDGSQQRMREEGKRECPPFYDARVNEATTFYRGCKWSQWTSKRSQKSLEVRPGPADYFFERQPNEDEIYLEKIRAFKRKTSKQLRFIEAIQQKNILDVRPGPTTYYPMLLKCTDLNFLGAKAKRFPASKDVSPGPADHCIKRDFDLAVPPNIPCHATLPKPACFGMKAKRFKIQCEEGPGPANYDVNLRLPHFVKCQTAPFGISAKRFKEEVIEASDDEEIIKTDNELLVKENEVEAKETCPTPTWEFKSKTIRMKPLLKRNDQPSPADLPQTRIKIERSSELQYAAPFFSSNGRFQPWYNWIPIQGNYKTPGPAEYYPEKPRCPPAFIRGPLCRAERFPTNKWQSPAPNTYKVKDGIERILATHNNRLKKNINNQYKFKWEQPIRRKAMGYEEKEALLFKKTIEMLGSGEVMEADTKPEVILNNTFKKPLTKNPKLLESFLYARPLPQYF